MRCAGVVTKTFLLAGIFVVLGAGAASAAAIGTVTGNQINVRREPTTDGAVYRQLSEGQTVTVTDKVDDWYKILCADNSVAYIVDDFIKIQKVDAKVNDNGVNLRSQADTSSAVLAQLSSGTALDVLSQAGDWYKVYCSAGTGFVHKDFVTGNLINLVMQEGETIPTLSTPEPAADSTTEATASSAMKYVQVNAATGLKLRTEPSTSSSVVELLSNNTGAEVLSNLGDWIQVKTTSGNVGYVSAQFVSLTNTLAQAADANASLADQIVAFAKQYIGTSYQWGGTNLSSGVDCSGFVYSVMKNFGISLNRSSASMAASNGTPVDKSNLQMGDLVFFDTSGANDGNVSHVGIYIGNGSYIHSSSGSSWGVTISSLYDDYSVRTYVSARRVL